MEFASRACRRLVVDTDHKTTRWKLVLFIRHLPQLSDQERVDMGHMNPKGPDDRDEEKDEEDFLGGEPVQQRAPSKHH